jgi:hypothetical protein
MNELMSMLSMLGAGSSLWVSLLGLIAVALFVVLAFNLLQSMQRRRRDAALTAEQSASMTESVTDAAITPGSRASAGAARQDGRVEPSLGAKTVGARSAGASAAAGVRSGAPVPTSGRTERIEPVLSAASTIPVAPVGEAMPPASGTLIERMGALRDTLPATDPPTQDAGRAAESRSTTSPSDTHPSVESLPAMAREPLSPGLATAPPRASGDSAQAPAAVPPMAPAAPAAPAQGSAATAAPSVTGAQNAAAPAMSAQRASGVSGRLDPHIDCIVQIRLPAPVAPERLVPAAAGLRRAGSKPVLVEADGGAAGWLGLREAGGPIDRLRVGLLLANRHGPLNAAEFGEFSEAVRKFSDAIHALETRLPDMAPVLEHARQVDEFCAQLDTMIGVNVQTPQPMNEAGLAELADALGLVSQLGQRYVRLSDDNEVLYAMSAGDRAEQITFLLDVPRAPQACQPWSNMVECARRCARATQGVLVDDAQHPLTDAAVAAVTRQLESHYKALDAAGLAAGSPAAVRVFN